MTDRACAVIIRDNKILFIEQIYGDEVRHMFIGGGVEENETPPRAVIRELREEANVSGDILFGPVTVRGEGRREHIFIVQIADGAVPSPGYDPEFPMDDQVIVNVPWYDIDMDIDKFTDRDMGYFSSVIAEAERQNVASRWLAVLKKAMANYYANS